MSLLKEANTIPSSMPELISDKIRRVALLISIYFPPEPGGGSTAAWNRAMILRKIGFSVFVLCGFPSYPSGKVLDPKYRRKFFYIEQLEKPLGTLTGVYYLQILSSSTSFSCLKF